MAHRNFTKEDFKKVSDNEYQVEFKVGEIGEGVYNVVERKTEKNEYEVILAQIKRFNDSIFISWSEPFDGRIIYEE